MRQFDELSRIVDPPPEKEKTMDNTKKARSSVGIWGAVATILVSVLAVWDIQVDHTLILDWLVAGGAFLGGIAALWGRWKADKKIEGV